MMASPDTHTCTHIQIEYYSAINKKEILPFSATWMDLEIITQSESEAAQSCPILLRLHGL